MMVFSPYPSVQDVCFLPNFIPLSSISSYLLPWSTNKHGILQASHSASFGWFMKKPSSSARLALSLSITGFSKESINEVHQKQNRSIHSDVNAEISIATSLQNATAPLVTALKSSAEQNIASFHFPGHNRGRAAPPLLSQLIGLRPFLHDLPELPELDNLFSPEGPILDAQKLAAELFGSTETWFLVGGTTCGVQAAIMATCSPLDTLILPRNSHISAISAMVLSGSVPKYIIPEYNAQWGIAGGICSSQIEKAIRELREDGRRAGAVLVTSPTYHGICSDIKKITELCHSQGIPVIVDEAHGAHFKFHPRLPSTALEQGADLVVQSTHKVLCSLTQSSMLHLSGHMVDRERICRCLQILQSSSPSYLLLASLDAARAQLSENPDNIFDRAMDLAFEARDSFSIIPGASILNSTDFTDFLDIDPLRLTIGVWKLGLSGYAADKILCEQGIIAELAADRSLAFAFNLGTGSEQTQRLISGIKQLSVGYSTKMAVGMNMVGGCGFAPYSDIEMRLNPRDAFHVSKRRVNFQESLGEICGELICPYPPGIPVLIPGEIISERALSYLLDVRNGGAMISGAADPLLSSILVCNF